MSAKRPLDPTYDPIIAAITSMPPARERGLEALRAPSPFSNAVAPEPVATVCNLTIPVDGAEMAARLYRPEAPEALMVYFHGGGFVMTGLDSHDLPLRLLANCANIAILSLDYRPAPENRFPVPLQDCIAGVRWADAHRGELGAVGLPLFVGGDSAGGNLAAAVSLHERDNGGPAIAGQLLFYPVIDGSHERPSWVEHAGCDILYAADMRWYWSCYCTEEERRDPLASPILAADLSGLPPAIVAVAEHDPLRDEALDYAEALRRAGVAATTLFFDDQPHGFFSFASLVPSAAAARDECVTALRALL